MRQRPSLTWSREIKSIVKGFTMKTARQKCRIPECCRSFQRKCSRILRCEYLALPPRHTFNSIIGIVMKIVCGVHFHISIILSNLQFNTDSEYCRTKEENGCRTEAVCSELIFLPFRRLAILCKWDTVKEPLPCPISVSPQPCA